VTDRAPVRIANCSGFYGDRLAAAREMVDGGPIDVLTGDYLAELTMLILAKAQAKDPGAGYARTFLSQVEDVLGTCLERGIRIVSNAGGLNPAGLAAAIDALGLPARVAYVEGDDLRGSLDAITPPVAGKPVSANAYLGGWGIAAALAEGADVVVTGRVTDASLVVGPAAWRFGWARDDWDRLAAGVLVGHLLECSGQVAGGNFSGDWWTVPDPWLLPYPIAEVAADGTAVITKPASSGGRVDVDTVRHQLLYEVHDPAAYLAPDVVADFTSATFTDLGDDRVRVTDVRGKPATDTYKALLAYPAGWSGETRVAFSWPDAAAKAKALTAIFMQRVEMAGIAVDEWEVELWGVDALGGDTVPSTDAEAPECVARIAWRCADQRTAASVGRELVPLALSAPPAGMTGIGRGGGAPTELLGIWPTLVEKTLVDPHVTVVVEEI